jgi:hypothetical protein
MASEYNLGLNLDSRANSIEGTRQIVQDRLWQKEAVEMEKQIQKQISTIDEAVMEAGTKIAKKIQGIQDPELAMPLIEQAVELQNSRFEQVMNVVARASATFGKNPHAKPALEATFTQAQEKHQSVMTAVLDGQEQMGAEAAYDQDAENADAATLTEEDKAMGYYYNEFGRITHDDPNAPGQNDNRAAERAYDEDVARKDGATVGRLDYDNRDAERAYDEDVARRDSATLTAEDKLNAGLEDPDAPGFYYDHVAQGYVDEVGQVYDENQLDERFQEMTDEEQLTIWKNSGEDAREVLINAGYEGGPSAWLNSHGEVTDGYHNYGTPQQWVESEIATLPDKSFSKLYSATMGQGAVDDELDPCRRGIGDRYHERRRPRYSPPHPHPGRGARAPRADEDEAGERTLQDRRIDSRPGPQYC